MDNSIHLKVTTPEGIILDEKVNYVLLPMVDGGYGVLYNHAPLIGALENGKLKYRIGGKDFFASVEGGIVQVADNEIIITTKSAKTQGTEI